MPVDAVAGADAVGRLLERDLLLGGLAPPFLGVHAVFGVQGLHPAVAETLLRSLSCQPLPAMALSGLAVRAGHPHPVRARPDDALVAAPEAAQLLLHGVQPPRGGGLCRDLLDQRQKSPPAMLEGHSGEAHPEETVVPSVAAVRGRGDVVEAHRTPRRQRLVERGEGVVPHEVVESLRHRRPDRPVPEHRPEGVVRIAQPMLDPTGHQHRDRRPVEHVQRHPV